MIDEAQQVERESAGSEVRLRAVQLSKSFAPTSGRGGEVQLFRGLNLEVAAGEMVAIMGASGSGKSSLLHLLAGLERPSAGQVWINATPLHDLPAARLAQIRNEMVGYVWQFHYLLPEFSALENVAMPLLARGMRHAAALGTARDWLRRVGLEDRAAHRSGELSGGEQQRVAIARALVTRPAVLLADEPTGDLDDVTAAALFRLLRQLAEQERLAALIVTHDAGIARGCDRVLHLVQGELRHVPLAKEPLPASESR